MYSVNSESALVTPEWVAQSMKKGTKELNQADVEGGGVGAME